MENKKKILVAGGDLRQIHLANLFASENDVSVYGFDQQNGFAESVCLLQNANEFTEALKEADLFILPMPAMENDTFINAPCSSQKISAKDSISLLSSHTIVFGGKITPSLRQLFSQYQTEYYDYLEREELAVMNASLTAEGTLQIILEELPVSIYGLKTLLVGSGRISKVLRKDLNLLGAKVSVSARKHSDLAWISLDNCNAIHTKNLKDSIGEFDLIINTVPAKILTEEILREIRPDALLIDLASKPGGIDFEVANRLGLKTIWALSLPGKVAPFRAGEIIYNTISNTLEERREAL